MEVISFSGRHQAVKLNDAESIQALDNKPFDSDDSINTISKHFSLPNLSDLPLEVEGFINNKIGLAEYSYNHAPPLSESVEKLSMVTSGIIARLAAPAISDDKASQMDANKLEFQASFTQFGQAASVLREVLSKTDAAIQEALQAMVELFNALNTLHEKLNKLARDKVEKSAVQAFNTALTTAALSALKEVGGFTATTIKTTKSINKSEANFGAKAEHLKQSHDMQLQGKAPAYDTGGKGKHNEVAGEYVSARRRADADGIQHKMDIDEIKFNRDMARIQAGKMAVDSITRMVEAEGNKESKLTGNEAKDAEFQASVAQRTIENFKNAMQQALQSLREYIEQSRTSQQNLMAK